MSRTLELQDEGNFSLQYSNSIPAVLLAEINGRSYYAKLTEIIIPVVFDKPVINIKISTTVPVGKIWEYAGRLRQMVDTGLGKSIVEQSDLSLIERNLIIFSKIPDNYSLRYKPPKWFIDLNIGIYQYDGSDSIASGFTLPENFSSINSKLDEIGLDVSSTKELIGG